MTVECRNVSNVYENDGGPTNMTFHVRNNAKNVDGRRYSYVTLRFAEGSYCCRVHFPSQPQLSAAFFICARTGRTSQQPFSTTVTWQESRKSKELLGRARASFAFINR